MSANALQTAVVERLESDPDVLAIIGTGRIFDRLITRAEPPYLVLGQATVADYSTGDADGSEHRFEIEAWTKQNGRKQAVELAVISRPDLQTADDRIVDAERRIKVAKVELQAGLDAVATYDAISDPDDVTNPDSYLVVAAGADGDGTGGG